MPDNHEITTILKVTLLITLINATLLIMDSAYNLFYLRMTLLKTGNKQPRKLNNWRMSRAVSKVIISIVESPNHLTY